MDFYIGTLPFKTLLYYYIGNDEYLKLLIHALLYLKLIIHKLLHLKWQILKNY